ncbi:hypothetical protein G3T14_17920 [Methylobacterium sp. BTF04]|uniref:hypothetical protein n=1 Tax=Methylobacterium sp. BTF04 TaxID=2708300 RepID=UPI0013D49756|nr:hypothetical protein [Methylobacterium sp. BTF04]NEU13992.1 hypothetical protein [Methylobacterium sp. BTF04]
MQALWNIAPWMRRRAQRHLERGSSMRVVQYILSSAGSDSAKAIETPVTTVEPSAHNIILFRALKQYS